ncbi:MAG: hypothetical protein WDN08_06735 [Rhizomicrobium sp.]
MVRSGTPARRARPSIVRCGLAIAECDGFEIVALQHQRRHRRQVFLVAVGVLLGERARRDEAAGAAARRASLQRLAVRLLQRIHVPHVEPQALDQVDRGFGWQQQRLGAFQQGREFVAVPCQVLRHGRDHADDPDLGIAFDDVPQRRAGMGPDHHGLDIRPVLDRRRFRRGAQRGGAEREAERQAGGGQQAAVRHLLIPGIPTLRTKLAAKQKQMRRPVFKPP